MIPHLWGGAATNRSVSLSAIFIRVFQFSHPWAKPDVRLHFPPVGYRNSASCFVRADVVRRGGRKKEVSEYELFLRLLYLFGGEIRDPGSLKNSRRLRPRVVRGTQTKNFGTYAVMHKRYTILFQLVKNVSSNYRFPDHIGIFG